MIEATEMVNPGSSDEGLERISRLVVPFITDGWDDEATLASWLQIVRIVEKALKA